MLAWWIFDRSPEQWKDLTAGVASVATAVALIAGGLWAWRNFRRTPESRIKITVRVELDLTQSSNELLIVRVLVSNDGGYPWNLWWSSAAATRRSQFGVDVFDESIPVNERHDVSRVTLWTLSGLPSATFANGFADWATVTPMRAELGCQDVELRPKDVWTNDVLFRIPGDTVAINAAAYIWVRSRDATRPIEAFRLEVVP